MTASAATPQKFEFESRPIVRTVRGDCPVEDAAEFVRNCPLKDAQACCPVTGASLIFFAVQRRRDEDALQLCKLLCDDLQAVRPTDADRHRQTALFFAARDGNLRCVEWLIARGCEVNHHDTALQTALFYAARDGRTDVVKLLLDRGADVNAVDHLGQTALFYACRDGRIQTVQLMLSRGADALVKDKFKKSASVYAQRNGHRELATLVRNYANAGCMQTAVASTVPSLGGRKKYRLQFRAPFDENLWLFAPKTKIEEFEKAFPDVAVWHKGSDPLPLNPAADPFRIQWQRVATEILNEIISYEGGWIFAKPVDPKAWNCPDYHQIIKRPMDLSTIKKRLRQCQYSKCQEFVDDMELVFSNCRAYNKPDSSVAKVGRNVEQYHRNLLLRKGFDVYIKKQEMLGELYDKIEGRETKTQGAAEETANAVDEDAARTSEDSEGGGNEPSSDGATTPRRRRRSAEPSGTATGGGKVFPGGSDMAKAESDSEEHVTDDDEQSPAKAPRLANDSFGENERCDMSNSDFDEDEQLFTPPNEQAD